MIQDLISTVIPVYNRAAQLREAVGSVLAQDWRPIEIIIVDDGSTDDTVAAAHVLAATHPDIVRVVSQPNAGPGAAREKGRRVARGEFIQYLDSDDILLPGKFRSQVEALRLNTQADVAYGITYLRDSNGRLVEAPHKKTGVRVAAMFPEFLVERWWDTSTPLYRTRVTDMAGPWTALRQEEDWEYDCRVASFGGRLAWVQRPVSESRDHLGIRLSGRPALDHSTIRDRAASHSLIYVHAQRAGIKPESPQMQHFARALFLLARQCGAAGLPKESRNLFDLSRRAAGHDRAAGADYRLYHAGASILGWTAAGRLACRIDDLRNQLEK
jgi:hypothetical protein